MIYDDWEWPPLPGLDRVETTSFASGLVPHELDRHANPLDSILRNVGLGTLRSSAWIGGLFRALRALAQSLLRRLSAHHGLSRPIRRPLCACKRGPPIRHSVLCP